MPIVAFRCPETGRRVEFDEAPEYFENLKVSVGQHGSLGLMPAEDVSALIEEIKNGPHSRLSPLYLSPSQVFPGNTCRRQQFIERFFPIVVDPRHEWEAMEGHISHRVRAMHGDEDKWHLEYTIPGGNVGIFDGVPKQFGLYSDMVKGARACEDGRVRLEILPGIWMSGTADRVSVDWKEIVDHKYTKFPRTFPSNGDIPIDYAEPTKYGPGSAHDEWPIQLSLYAHLLEKVTGVEVERLGVWRTYKSSRNRAYTFRKLAIEKWSLDHIEVTIGQHVRQALDWFKRGAEAKDDAARLAVLNEVPLEGRDKQMFAGTKCSKFCIAQSECELHAGGSFAF